MPQFCLPLIHKESQPVGRRTSYDGGRLVLRVEWAAAPSVLCNDLTGITLDKGEVCSTLKETHET